MSKYTSIEYVALLVLMETWFEALVVYILTSTCVRTGKGMT